MQIELGSGANTRLPQWRISNNYIISNSFGLVTKRIFSTFISPTRQPPSVSGQLKTTDTKTKQKLTNGNRKKI
jgi:hypothetical protein